MRGTGNGISVVIPVKNGAATLGRCLESIRKQEVHLPVEIIVLDSGSTDGSTAIATQYAAKVVPVPSGTFNHGVTRNNGVAMAQGNLVFLTVQDAWLSDNQVLQQMADWFEDTAVMGVSGHQAVPHEKDKNPMLWFKRFTEPVAEIRQWQPGTSMPPFSWDNVVAMYRKTALEQLPFEKTDTTEDWIWAFEALKKGWKLVYDPSLVIWHYHHRTFFYVMRSEFAVMHTLYKRLGIVPEYSEWFNKNIKIFYHLIKHRDLNFLQKLRWIWHNILANSSYNFTVILFKTARTLASRRGLDFIYNKLCSKIPQGKQNQVA